MNNLKKVGLSALAGSLAMVSAHAGDFVVGGGAELTYTSKSGADTGNPLGMSHNIKFTGSGEVNGIGWTVMSDTAGQDFASDSSYLKFDLGDIGTIAVEQGADSSGIGSLANNTPTAYEEADHQTGSLGDGLDAAGDTTVVAYNGAMGGVGISVEWNPTTAGSGYNQAGAVSTTSNTGSNINYALKYDLSGIQLAFGQSMTNYSTAGNPDDSELTYSVNYAFGPVKVGVQKSEIDNGVSTAADYDVTAYAIAFNINDDLSISYGISDNTKDNKAGVADVTEENRGIMAAYSMGSAAARISLNSTDNVGGVSASNADVMEISLNLSF
jgi:outer membrane protein OmpU